MPAVQKQRFNALPEGAVAGAECFVLRVEGHLCLRNDGAGV